MEFIELSGQYRMGKTLGCGGFAEVKLATHILTGEKVAVKVMQKEALMEDLPRVKQEINALKSLTHNNICKLYQVVETNTHYFLIMEYCCGGELFDHIIEKEKLSEQEARLFFQQIVSAVYYLHSQGFAHRDLKPENILLDKNGNLKLIDFGISAKPENGLEACLYTSCGSPNYAAPELIRGETYLGREVDIWSLGVLLYTLLCGTLPFEDASIQKLYEKILCGHYEEKSWLSPESKSLLRSLLQVNPKRRITMDKLKTHPWFKRAFDNFEEKVIPKLVKDNSVLKVMSQHFKKSSEDLWTDITQENYDYMMATYLLLLDKKRNGEPVKLLNPFATPKREILGNSLRQTIEKTRSEKISRTPLQNNDTFVVEKEKKIKTASCNDENRISGRKNCKRIRSPGLEDKSGPLPKRIREVKTPDSAGRNYLTPIKRSKKILVGIEKSLSRAKSVSIPFWKSSSTDQPTVLWGKELSNVSSTTSKSPDKILSQLQNALKAKGISCTQKGYILKGKLKQLSKSKSKGKEDEDKLSFELEVCWIPSLSEPRTRKATGSLNEAVVGIRRKRLKGDAWIYKNICEEVLALAAPLKT